MPARKNSGSGAVAHLPSLVWSFKLMCEMTSTLLEGRDSGITRKTMILGGDFDLLGEQIFHGMI
jgi:hypothetical protein